LAVACVGVTVSVLLGDGTGGFGAKTDFAASFSPYSVAIADLSGDGKPDLAVANYGANTVSVLLGDGAGGFGTKADFATGMGPYSVAIGDVSADGRLDVAVANQLSNTVSVLLGLLPTRTALAVSPNPAGLGAPLTMAATVTVPAPGYGTPSGTVSFFDGTTPLGTSPVEGGGVSHFIWFAPYLGEHPITAVYGGNGRLLGSISPVHVQRADASTTRVGNAGVPPAFALGGAQPNPSRGERVSVVFSLPASAPARLELVDVSGRRLMMREVGSLGAGHHVVNLITGRRLPPGIYVVRLAQGANVTAVRVAVVD
jgi:hypothetical protein